MGHQHIPLWWTDLTSLRQVVVVTLLLLGTTLLVVVCLAWRRWQTVGARDRLGRLRTPPPG